VDSLVEVPGRIKSIARIAMIAKTAKIEDCQNRRIKLLSEIAGI
jgi:hypothetical protein